MDDLDVTVEVTNVNERPDVDSPIADRTMTVSVSRIISLQGTFRDPEGDTLTYTATSSNIRVATASVNVRDITLTLGALAAGSATVTITAADRTSGDAYRLTASQAFTVTVEPNAPAKVTDLTGTSGSVRGTINLNWDPADRADDYEVAQWKRRLGPIFHWVVLDPSEATIDTANTSAVVTGLIGGETYRHRVRGIRGTGSGRVEGDWSDHVDTTLTLPEKVRGLSGMPGTNHGEIDLDWDMADGASGYQVRQSESGNAWVVLSPGSSGFNINGTAAVVSDLNPDETYRYQVRATGLHGEGEWSDTTTAIAVRDERPDKPARTRCGPRDRFQRHLPRLAGRCGSSRIRGRYHSLSERSPGRHCRRDGHSHRTDPRHRLRFQGTRLEDLPRLPAVLPLVGYRAT